MQAIFIPPRENFSGNLVWNTEEFKESKTEIESSLAKLREIGYWASPFPEGDGVVFTINENDMVKTGEQMLNDFVQCFDWVEIKMSSSGDSNSDLADLELEREMQCRVIVPLDKLYVQNNISIGPYTFFSKRHFDSKAHERYSDSESEYLQFETSLFYKDLLRTNKNLIHDDYVIAKCLALAEHALDLVRYECSSFIIREFTPDPAGQLSSGFYAVKIIPLENTHLKEINLESITKPLSFKNNWLGPQLDDFVEEGIDYLADIYSGNIENQITALVIGALRSCRQSFYSLGYESSFLNLLFTLDGLSQVTGTGWRQRIYIAALLSKNSPDTFESKLIRYNELYAEVRNKFVHEGMEFYQLTEDPNQACEDMYGYIKDVIKLIAKERFTTIEDMNLYVTNLLRTQDYIDKFTHVINTVSQATSIRIPSW